MNTKLSLILILFSIGLNLSAQEYIIRVKKMGSNKFFYINEKGKSLTDKKYFTALDFCEQGAGIVKLDRSSDYLIIDKKEELIKSDVPLVPFINDWTGEIYGFRYGMVRTIFAEKVGALNTNGKLSVPTIYKKLSDFDGNYAIGVIDKTYYVVKNSGDQIILEYEKIKAFKHFSEGFAAIKIGKLWGVIDTLGQLLIEPQFKAIGYFNGGIAWVKNSNDKVGYINEKGIWIIIPHYDVGMDYDKTSGLARVKKYNKWGYVDTDKHFDDLSVSGSFHSFYEGLAVKRSNGKVGYINNTGAWVIKPVFTTAYKFENGFAKVAINGLWGLIDKESKFFVPLQYKFIGNAVRINN